MIAQPDVLWNRRTVSIVSGVAVSANSSPLNQLSDRQAALAAALLDAVRHTVLDGGLIIATIPGAADGEDASAMLVAVGALLTGETWCLVRPAEAAPGSPTRVGPNLVPQLVAALQASLGVGEPGES